ncbi:MAG: dihydroorotase [Eubacterium sp.]|nr:dihydroorotase [Eubacterium sp.]
MSILIKGGRVIDPSDETDAVRDILIDEGKIVKVSENIDESADEIIDAKGQIVMPAFIDLHVHLRDPGQTYKETIESGCAAAAKGGFTRVFAMPNTKPVADSAEIIKDVEERAKKTGVKVHQVGAITKGQMNKELADLEGMYNAGCIALSEDGKSVMNSQLYREAMEFAAAHDMVVMAHCEDINLVHGGVMNRDEKSKELGLPGITNATEDVIIARDILLSKETGARLHLCHCSTEDSVRMIREAKEDGLKVSGEVCPHHFTLCTEDIPGDDANFKMNPPLRTREDMEILREGLEDDIMDVISTDHAPHSAEEKAKSMKEAPFGIVGLETSLALSWTTLVEGKYLTPMQLAKKMSLNPAKIAHVEGGSLAEGKPGDVVVFNVSEEYEINPDKFVSMGKNTPFAGKKVKGRVLYTISDGKIIYKNK